MMASAGFDGTIRQWNLKNLTMEHIVEDRNANGRDKVLQGVVWCKVVPQKGMSADSFANLVVVGTSAGIIKLIDLSKSKVIDTIKAGNQNTSIYGLDWNADGLLAIGSTEENVQIKKFE